MNALQVWLLINQGSPPVLWLPGRLAHVIDVVRSVARYANISYCCWYNSNRADWSHILISYKHIPQENSYHELLSFLGRRELSVFCKFSILHFVLFLQREKQPCIFYFFIFFFPFKSVFIYYIKFFFTIFYNLIGTYKNLQIAILYQFKFNFFYNILRKFYYIIIINSNF